MLKRAAGSSFDSQTNEDGRSRATGARTKDKVCQYCEKAFKKTEHLLRHERSHTKEKPFRCELCNKGYTRQYSLQPMCIRWDLANHRSDTLLRHSKAHDLELSDLQAGITLSQMNHDNRVSAGDQDSGRGAGHYAIERPQSDLDPQLENIQGSQLEMPEAVYPSAISGNTLHTFSTETPIGVGGQAQFTGEPFSMLAGNTDGVSPLSANNPWGASLMSMGPVWLTDYDFDLEALNTSVSAAVETAEPLFQSHNNRNLAQNMPPSEVIREGEVRRDPRIANDNIRRGWFSHIDRLNEEDDHGGLASGQLTPATTGDQYDIGDSFRHRIYQRLKARTIDEPLPSTQFLVGSTWFTNESEEKTN